MNSARLDSMVRQASAAMRQARDDAVEAAKDKARTERDYKKHKATLWAKKAGEPGLAKVKEAQVDADAADLGYERDLAASMERILLKVMDDKRAELSALQSVAKAYVAEAEFDRTAPRGA